MSLFGNIAEAVRDLATDPDASGTEAGRATDPAAHEVAPASPLGEALHGISGALKDIGTKVLEATEATVESIDAGRLSPDDDVILAVPIESDDADEIEATAAEAPANAAVEEEGEVDADALQDGSETD